MDNTAGFQPHIVWISRAETVGYGSVGGGAPVELPAHVPVTVPLLLLRSLFKEAGLDSENYGTPEWNPLGEIISPGDKVLIKPNWVNDRNHNPGAGWECLVTHPAVVEGVLHYVIKTRPKMIVVGDAPIQDCDFVALLKNCGYDSMHSRFTECGCDISFRDFRTTKMPFGIFGSKVSTERGQEANRLFNLSESSWLEAISTSSTEFRVANYDPRVLKLHHFPTLHQYLVAHEAVDADVVINLPKLKTHKKTGITGAIKNMVGICGFKEYLPHHRKGGADGGGDCYQRGSLIKRLLEDAVDRANMSKSFLPNYVYRHLAGAAARAISMFERDSIIEGSWHGNDTVWRTCLDLQRILHYGKEDGTLAESPRRRVFTITDAIVAGEGEGPLSPRPVPLGLMTMGSNVAALEWVHCLLMGFDPRKIPIVSNAFAQGIWPLAEFSPSEILVNVNGKTTQAESIQKFGTRFSPSAGWKGHCELDY
jgi:uncharacterized protein (DUF362 family)